MIELVGQYSITVVFIEQFYVLFIPHDVANHVHEAIYPYQKKKNEDASTFSCSRVSSGAFALSYSPSPINSPTKAFFILVFST